MDRADRNKGSVINASRDIRTPEQARNCYTSLVTEDCVFAAWRQFRFPKVNLPDTSDKETQLHYNWTTCSRALHDNRIVDKTVTDFPGSLPFPQEATTGLYNGPSTNHILASHLFMIRFHVISHIVQSLHFFQIPLHTQHSVPKGARCACHLTPSCLIWQP